MPRLLPDEYAVEVEGWGRLVGTDPADVSRRAINCCDVAVEFRGCDVTVEFRGCDVIVCCCDVIEEIR